MRAILVVVALALLVVAVPALWVYGSAAPDSRAPAYQSGGPTAWPTPTEVFMPTAPHAPCPWRAFEALPPAEQTRIVSCVRLTHETLYRPRAAYISADVSIEVADVFMLGYPRPGFLFYLEKKYGPLTFRPSYPGAQPITITQWPRDVGFHRNLQFGTEAAVIQINLFVSPSGEVMEGGISFAYSRVGTISAALDNLPPRESLPPKSFED